MTWAHRRMVIRNRRSSRNEARSKSSRGVSDLPEGCGWRCVLSPAPRIILKTAVEQSGDLPKPG